MSGFLGDGAFSEGVKWNKADTWALTVWLLSLQARRYLCADTKSRQSVQGWLQRTQGEGAICKPSRGAWAGPDLPAPCHQCLLLKLHPVWWCYGRKRIQLMTSKMTSGSGCGVSMIHKCENLSSDAQHPCCWESVNLMLYGKAR